MADLENCHGGVAGYCYDVSGRAKDCLPKMWVKQCVRVTLACGASITVAADQNIYTWNLNIVRASELLEATDVLMLRKGTALTLDEINLIRKHHHPQSYLVGYFYGSGSKSLQCLKHVEARHMMDMFRSDMFYANPDGYVENSLSVLEGWQIMLGSSKKLPKQVLSMDVFRKASFIAGFLDASATVDGHFKCGMGRRAAVYIQAMLLEMGVSAAVAKTKFSGYSLKIARGTSSALALSLLHLHNLALHDLLSKNSEYKDEELDGTVVSVENIGYEMVYKPNPKSYVNGVDINWVPSMN